MTRIDVHQHLLPPAYRAWLDGQGIEDAGGRALPDWSAEDALGLMDRMQIGTAILSLSTPGTSLPSKESPDMARQVNEFAAELVKDRPDRFGFFATTPLPNVDAALESSTYALDELAADGVCLLANNDGTYVGDPSFEPLLAELDRRAAVVFVHPAALPAPPVPGIPPFAVDFLLDTTRAAVNLVLHDVPRRFPNLKIILSHGGGFVPYASHRIMAAIFAETGRGFDEILESLASFWFDTALTSSPASLPTLQAFAKPERILYGSDWPFAPELGVGIFTGNLDGHGMPPEQLAAINRDNALALFPRMA